MNDNDCINEKKYCKIYDDNYCCDANNFIYIYNDLN